jgi:hypothetical protein
MNDTHTLIPMGAGEPETFRCRIYGVADDPEAESKRRAFLTELAGPGVIDCEAIDPWTAALQERGWLPDAPVIELHPDGSGRKVGRWHLTPAGRAAWAEIETSR